MVLFTERSQRIFPELVTRISDNQIRDVLATTSYGQEPFSAAFSLSALLPETFQTYVPYPLYDVEGVTKFTFTQNSYSAMKEGVDTTSLFPLRVMNLANHQFSLLYGEGMYDTLYEIAHDLRSSWFHGLCNTAGFTRNGLWGAFSTSTAVAQNPTDTAHQLLQFDFGINADQRPTFHLRAHSEQLLLSELRSSNQRYLKWASSVKRQTGKLPTTDSWDSGTSSGCPVSHLEPHFQNQLAADISLVSLSKVFGADIETMTAKRELTGISIGLNALADLLDRACAVSS